MAKLSATRPSCVLALAVILIAAGSSNAFAQSSGRLDQGFKVRVPAFPTGEERTRQPGLWMLDVELKPMRLRYLDLTNPQTGEVSNQQVWYLVYRVYNKPFRAADTAGSVDPVNTLDTPYTRPMFEPELTLVTYDNPADQIPEQTIVGDIRPEAVNGLRPIEERTADITLNGAISAIRPLPEPTDDGAPIFGVAVFRDVDPETDFFKVIFRGFTNAYEIREDSQGKRVWRKVLVQKFKRPGDRFDPNQREFDFDGEPEWMYVPDTLVDDVDIIAANDELKAAQPAAEE